MPRFDDLHRRLHNLTCHMMCHCSNRRRPQSYVNRFTVLHFVKLFCIFQNQALLVALDPHFPRFFIWLIQKGGSQRSLSCWKAADNPTFLTKPPADKINLKSAKHAISADRWVLTLTNNRELLNFVLNISSLMAAVLIIFFRHSLKKSQFTYCKWLPKSGLMNHKPTYNTKP